MSIQNNKFSRLHSKPQSAWLILGAWLLMLPVSLVWASGTAITGINFSSLTGDKVQIHLTMDGPVTAPKVFQTDNPARIALDFSGVNSALAKKRFTVNQGAVNTVYVVQAGGRTRVIVNLSETVPYETKVVDNNVYIVLKPVSLVGTIKTPEQKDKVDISIAKFLPEQTIKNIDFRRGPKGEGRLMLELSAPNTVVDVKQEGGKVVLNFLNTRLLNNLERSFDVTDFATPVRKVDARSKGAGVKIVITTVDGNYDYSSYQSDGLLIVDFIPLSAMEKEALLKKKFPYIGKKLTLNFQDIEVRSVLQILADFTDLNIIAADTVGGNVTLRLNDVPWDQALDLILKSKGLAKRQTGNVVLVAPTAEIIKIEEDELAAKKVQKLLEPLRTEYIQINYAKAEDIQAILVGSNVVQSATESSSSSGKSNSFGGSNSSSNNSSSRIKTETKGVLSERGSSTVDARTNTIIVKDTSRQLKEVREMIKILDIPIRQVMIEARVVIADNNFAQEIGVKFGVAKPVSTSSSGQTFGANLGGGNAAGAIGSSALLDLGANAINKHPVGALGMTLARGANYVLNLELSALENEKRGEVLANPRILTTDRTLAVIKQGIKKQITVPGSANNPPTQKFIDVVLELNVTPQITPNGAVIMDLRIKKDNEIAGSQDFAKREVKTTVQVEDGETIVLGGVYEGTSANNEYKVPFLSDLPGIGFLFRKKSESDTKQELLIFVTPKIVKDSLSVR